MEFPLLLICIRVHHSFSFLQLQLAVMPQEAISVQSLTRNISPVPRVPGADIFIVTTKTLTRNSTIFSKIISQNENGVWVLSLSLDGCMNTTSSTDTYKSKVFYFYYLQKKCICLKHAELPIWFLYGLPSHCPVTQVVS